MSPAKPIGFIGLGNMGSGMVKNLLKNGYRVYGFDTDTTKTESFEDTAFVRAKSIEDITIHCDVVLLCLPNPEISKEVIFEKLLIVGSKITALIETSTLTPEIVTDFSESLHARGVEFLSAPMIGGKTHAAKGTTKFLVEGSREYYDKYLELFQAMGSQAAYVGIAPSATLAKIAFNISRYANLAVGVETYRLLKKYDANIPAIYEFMSEQSLDNFGQVWGEDLKEMMTSNTPFKPSQVPKKDLALLAEMAKRQGLNDSVIQSVRNTYLSMEKSNE